MRLSWATDIHLNFVKRSVRSAFCDGILAQEPDVVILSGDIADGRTLEESLRAVAAYLQRPLYFVLGNHDFYHSGIGPMRKRMAALTSEHTLLRWLPAVDVVALDETWALVGHDGWGDGRLGNFENSPVMLNDWEFIDELHGLGQQRRLAAMRALGDEAATYLRQALQKAMLLRKRILLVTHVPPFAETCWHEGRMSDEDWLPWFTCKAVGDVLFEAFSSRPDVQGLVLCGHTHGGGEVQVLPNLLVKTGAAEYGDPRVQPTLVL